MRFRLKTLFLLTFLVALACMVLFALPDWLCLILLTAFAMATPGAIISGIIYGRKAVRAFAVGCLASGGWALWLSPIVLFTSINGDISLSEEPLTAKMIFVGFYGILTFGGLASVGVRRLCYQGHNRIRPPRDCC